MAQDIQTEHWQLSTGRQMTDQQQFSAKGADDHYSSDREAVDESLPVPKVSEDNVRTSAKTM